MVNVNMDLHLRYIRAPFRRSSIVIADFDQWNAEEKSVFHSFRALPTNLFDHAISD
jgi:hypothetical protein